MGARNSFKPAHTLAHLNLAIVFSQLFLGIEYQLGNITIYSHKALIMYRLSATLLALAPCVLGTPVSLTERDYSSPTCSNDSTHNFQWLVQGFDFHASYIFSTPAHQNSWGYVNFNLSNPAVPDVLLSCSAQSDQLQDFFYGTQWYKCTTNGTSYGPAPASFAFNRPTGELDINQTWTCRDRDPKWP